MTRFPILAALLLSSCAHAPEAEPADPLVIVMESEPVNAKPVCPANGTVRLQGPIEDPEFFVGTMAACKDRPVVVEINSPGGDLSSAIEMQKAIERHPHMVVCVVDGMAASAAFVTLQTCPIRFMTSRSILMAHNAATKAIGQSQALKNRAAMLEKIDRGTALQCARRMGMDPAEYEKRVSGGKEWWMGVEDALAFKAVDAEAPNAVELAKFLNGPTAPDAADGGTP